MEEIIFEKECDIPENWVSNTVLIRDGRGNIIEIDAPDDIEEG